MGKPKIVTHAGVTLDLAQVRCFNLSPFIVEDNDTRQLIVEFKTRLEYVLNPNNQQWEKEYFTERITCDFPSYDTAQAYLREWEEIWQDYLDEQEA